MFPTRSSGIGSAPRRHRSGSSTGAIGRATAAAIDIAKATATVTNTATATATVTAPGGHPWDTESFSG